MTPPRNYTYIILRIAELVAVGSFVHIREKKPKKVESNPSACEDFKDGSDNCEHAFGRIIMAEQCKVINV